MARLFVCRKGHHDVQLHRTRERPFSTGILSRDHGLAPAARGPFTGRYLLIFSYLVYAASFSLPLRSWGEGPDVLIICPDGWQAELGPWMEHRRQQGHRLQVIQPDRTANKLRQQIEKHSADGDLRYVLLIGDVPDGMNLGHGVPAQRVDTLFRLATENSIVSDHALISDDQAAPRVAIGRLPVDNAIELRRLLARTIAYETSTDHGDWRRQVQLIAGCGNYGPIVDSAIEAVTRRILRDTIPATFRTTLTYASSASPYCPNPRTFRDCSVARFNEGCLLWVYMGHGTRQSLCGVHLSETERYGPVFTTADCTRLAARRGAPIAALISCYAGDFSSADCLAEEMLRSEGGPVAVIGASGITAPYGNASLGMSILSDFFSGGHPLLGDIWLQAKRKAVSSHRNPSFVFIDMAARLLGESPALLAAERREHNFQYHLLGDPLLRLAQMQSIELQLVGDASAGKILKIQGKSGVDGRASVELVCPRDQCRAVPANQNVHDVGPATPDQRDEVYEQANNDCWARTDVGVERGELLAELPIPREVEGTCHVRVFVQGTAGSAAGAIDVTIATAANETRPLHSGPEHRATMVPAQSVSSKVEQP